MQIPTVPGEEWRQASPSGNYWVSSHGRFWSRPRPRTRGGILATRVSTRGATSGRQIVMIDQKNRLAHQVVAEAFHGPRPAGMETRHLNGDMTDNRAVNLAWGTRSENVQDMLRHGTHPQVVKAECPMGHPLDGEYRNRRGSRVCRPCANRQSREYNARKRAAS